MARRQNANLELPGLCLDECRSVGGCSGLVPAFLSLRGPPLQRNVPISSRFRQDHDKLEGGGAFRPQEAAIVLTAIAQRNLQLFKGLLTSSFEENVLFFPAPDCARYLAISIVDSHRHLLPICSMTLLHHARTEKLATSPPRLRLEPRTKLWPWRCLVVMNTKETVSGPPRLCSAPISPHDV